jgi:hypothetical protein
MPPLAIVQAHIFVWNQFEKNVRRSVAHKTGEVTFCVVLEAAARRVGRLVVDLRQLQAREFTKAVWPPRC